MHVRRFPQHARICALHPCPPASNTAVLHCCLVRLHCAVLPPPLPAVFHPSAPTHNTHTHPIHTPYTTGMAGPDVQQLRVSPTTDPSKLRDAIVAKMLQNQQATLRFATSAGALPAQMLTVAMTAVAAARVRLQSKRADVDVGVMPQVLPPDSDANAAASGAGGGSRAGGSDSNKRSSRAGQQVIYSLRLVPMPAAAAAQPAAAAPAPVSAAAADAAAA